MVDIYRRIQQAREQNQNGFVVQCPKHEDSRPSLKIFTDGRAQCFAGCYGGKQRPVKDFFPDLDIGSLPQGLRSNWQLQRDQDTRAYREILKGVDWLIGLRRRYQHQDLSSGEVGQWMRSRAFTPAVVSPWVLPLDAATTHILVARYGTDVCKRYALLGRPGRRAIIVARDERGNPMWHQLVATTDKEREFVKYLNPTAVSPHIFGLDTLAGARTVVVVEGMTDALAALDPRLIPLFGTRHERIGAVALQGASMVKASIAKQVLALAPRARIVIATDRDEAGEQASARLMRFFRANGAARVERWNVAVKDVNEALRLRSTANLDVARCPESSVIEVGTPIPS